LHGAALHLCGAKGNSHAHLWLEDAEPLTDGPVHKVKEHFTGDAVISDNAGAQWSANDNGLGRPAHHGSSFFPDRYDLAGVHLLRYHGRFLKNNPSPPYIDQDVHRPQIDAQFLNDWHSGSTSATSGMCDKT
jgi:hypothetical protein